MVEKVTVQNKQNLEATDYHVQLDHNQAQQTP